MKLVRLATLAIAASIVSAALPIAGSAQAPPGSAANAAQPDGWEVSFAPRMGYFLPQQGASGSQRALRRPTYGMELAVKRKDSWYGARALFERSMAWEPQQDLATELLGNPSSPRNSSELEYFETVMVDAVFYTPVHQGVRGYMFSGYGSKIIGATDGTPILPYSLTGAERERAWHGGFGVEAPLGGGSLLFEVGDYYGRNGGETRVHDVHVTLMARISGVDDFVRTLVTGDESDG